MYKSDCSLFDVEMVVSPSGLIKLRSTPHGAQWQKSEDRAVMRTAAQSSGGLTGLLYRLSTDHVLPGLCVSGALHCLHLLASAPFVME